jgi:Arc/MetJ family transcription regulator
MTKSQARTSSRPAGTVFQAEWRSVPEEALAFPAAARSHALGAEHDRDHVREVSLISEVGIQDILIISGGTSMTMVKTPVEIDQEALALAAEVLGTKTKKDTVNAALREVGQRLDRLRALARLREMADQGDFDEFTGNKAAYRR